MKFAYMLAISVALVLAPVAQAQVSCKQANDLVDIAFEGFSSIEGEAVSDGIYKTTLTLDGATGCQITSDFSSAYSCMWTYASLEEAQADYGLHSHALADCYGEWDREPFTSDSGEAGVKTLDGVSYYSEDDQGGEYTWITYIEEHVDGDARDWHVWIGLDYF